MKQLITLTLSIFLSIASYAKCMSNGIYQLGNAHTLQAGGIFVLEFYGESQKLVSELNKKYPIYLLNNKQKFTLNIVEVLVGEDRMTQVVFKADTSLKAGNWYSLHIDKLPEEEQAPGRYNSGKGKWQSLSFLVEKNSNKTAPVLLNTPAESSKVAEELGCGPVRWVNFRISTKDSLTSFVRVTVKNQGNRRQTTYLLAIKNGEVAIGRGMCGGPFDLEDGKYYDVNFELVDFAGNKSKTSKTIVFVAPTSSVKS